MMLMAYQVLVLEVHLKSDIKVVVVIWWTENNVNPYADVQTIAYGTVEYSGLPIYVE